MIKGVTDKDPITYKPGEKMAFTLTVQGLDGALPADTYFLDWKVTDDFGRKETGRAPLTADPFVKTVMCRRPTKAAILSERPIKGPNLV